MPIVGFRFTSMEGKKIKKEMLSGDVKVNSVPRVITIKEVDIPTFDKKALSLEFEFETSYEPKIANIKITGDILYRPENSAKILKEWKKNKKLPDEMNMEILNNLFRRCLIKISVIADDLQLPPPLQLPRIKPKDEEAGYVG